MFFGIRKTQKKEEPADKRALLKKIALGKLGYLGRKKADKKTIDDLYWVLKVFFKNYFGISQELDYAELIETIENKRIDAQIKERTAKLVNFFLEAKYGGKRYAAQDLKNIAKEAKSIIKVI